MRDLIVILVLYVRRALRASAGCGGMRAAGRSIEDWGRRSTTRGGTPRSPLS